MVRPLNGSHFASAIDAHRPHAMLACYVLQRQCETIATRGALDRLQSPV